MRIPVSAGHCLLWLVLGAFTSLTLSGCGGGGGNSSTGTQNSSSATQTNSGSNDSGTSGSGTQIGFYANVQANDIAWDPVNQRIYLSIPSSAGAYGNTVQALDPVARAWGVAGFAGSEPNLLSLSKNSKYLYVSLRGAPNVQRLALPALSADTTIALGSDSLNGPYYALDLQAAPNSDETVAVIRGVPGVSPSEEGGVAIYDNATLRPNTLCGWIQPGCANNSGGIFPPLYDSFQWNADGSAMFLGGTYFDFYTVPVTAAGFGTLKDYAGMVAGSGTHIHYDSVTHYVYDDGGKVIDPASGAIVGTFTPSFWGTGVMVPDGSLGKVFFLGQPQSVWGSSTYYLQSFDINHFTLIKSVALTNVTGTPQRLIRWGTNGLAFNTTTLTGSSQHGAVYVIDGAYVP